jgi:hypothetical protein
MNKIIDEINKLVHKLQNEPIKNQKIDYSKVLDLVNNLKSVSSEKNSIYGHLLVMFSIENELTKLELDIAESYDIMETKKNSFSTNRFIAIAHTSNKNPHVGEVIEVKIIPFTFDAYRFPIVKAETGVVKKIKDGIVIVNVKAEKEGDLKIKGRCGIPDRFGSLIWKDYETSITVVKK